jgi:hypothetical protein
MKQSQKIILYTETLSTAKSVIPAPYPVRGKLQRESRLPPAQRERTGFPRIKYGAGLIKSGMTDYIRPESLCIVRTFITILILLSIAQFGPTTVYGQPIGKMSISRESGRDPFVLPPGIHLLSKSDTNSVTKGPASSGATLTTEIKPMDIPLKVTAILVSDRVRLASIGRHIVTVGDSILDERILEIKNDRVILGKGDKKRTLLLSQSPVRLTVEER